MTEQATDAATAVKDAMTRLDTLEEQFNSMKAIPPPANENQGGTQQVTQVTHGGDRAATWILLVATALVIGINLGQRDAIAQQSAQINDMRSDMRRVVDYQTTTFMLVPKLREEVEKAINEREERKAP